MRANTNGRVGRAFTASAATACLLLLTLLAGCGASRPGSPAEAATRVPASSPCTTTARLTAGMTVASWRLGAVHFVTPGTGVAVTAPQIPCRNGASQAQSVMLAVSTDAGRRWVTEGSAFPFSKKAPAIDITERVAALSARNVWVLTSTGKVFATRNGGRTWTLQPLPAPVVTLAQTDGELTALSCPPFIGQEICHPQLHRMRMPAGAWRAEPLPRLTTSIFPQLSIASADAAVLLITPYPSRPAELVSTTDGGARWTTRPVPAGPSRPAYAEAGRGGMCALPYVPLLATASASDWWLLCAVGQGMEKAIQAVMRTTDGGRTWHVMAQTPSMFKAFPPGALSDGDPFAFTAFSPTLLWITADNYVTYSSDAGRTWTDAPDAVNPGGAPGLFDILSPSDAWLLAPGTALWHTTDGIHWDQAGASFYS